MPWFVTKILENFMALNVKYCDALFSLDWKVS